MTDAASLVRAYHERTKHHLERYAPGPETLDWDAQPDPFRHFEGGEKIALGLDGDNVATSFASIFQPGAVTPVAVNRDTVGTLLRLSFGLSAWKEYGPDRWAVRCNPSSGNLHPTEAYVVARSLPGLDDGVYHYLSLHHDLERRARPERATPVDGGPRLWIGLSSIHWREAWKYGERAFRYCALDLGHALGALRYATAALGWRARIVPGFGADRLAALLGLDRSEDFAGVEREDPDVLVAIGPAADLAEETTTGLDALSAASLAWTGRANHLDPRPMYRWPVIDAVAAATRGFLGTDRDRDRPRYPAAPPAAPSRLAALVLKRRSAQRFDGKHAMDRDIFFKMMDALLVRDTPPWDIWDQTTAIHPMIWVHRVEGIEPGLYALPRRPAAEAITRRNLGPDFAWTRVETAPAHLPLFLLARGDYRKIARTICCHQAIAGDSCFALGMLADFGEKIERDASTYRRLFWEAGLVGHALYLEAEAAGLRGTGIGCFFDDKFHDLLGLRDGSFQSLYHFTVGRPLEDERISTTPPYGDRPSR